MSGISSRAYAEHRRSRGLPGQTKSAVDKALADGRISRTPEGKIDPEEADAAWAANTGKRGINGTDPTTYSKAKADREGWLAKIAELEYHQKRARLVDAEEVRRELFSRSRAIRERLLAIPARLAPGLLGVETAREMEDRLREELVSALQDLSGSNGDSSN
jgi:phage terminase Nu1 subunit (DNA packaging protein)